MSVEIVTKEDLQIFRQQLLNDIRQLLVERNSSERKVWLKSSEVRDILKISVGSLQNLRINGTLHPSKIGGILYYRFEEIEKLLG